MISRPHLADDVLVLGPVGVQLVVVVQGEVAERLPRRLEGADVDGAADRGRGEARRRRHHGDARHADVAVAAGVAAAVAAVHLAARRLQQLVMFGETITATSVLQSANTQLLLKQFLNICCHFSHLHAHVIHVSDVLFMYCFLLLLLQMSLCISWVAHRPPHSFDTQRTVFRSCCGSHGLSHMQTLDERSSDASDRDF